MIPYVFRKQIKLFCLFFACCFLILTIFLFFLQIINGNHYRQQAQKLQIRTLTQQAARGKITDRYGTVLADNKTIYQVLFFPSEADRAQWNNSLVSALMLMRSVNVPCTVSFPIEKQGQRYCFSQDADAVSRLLETCKLPSDATAFEALQVLMKKYDAQQIPEEISLSLLAVRYQLNLQSYRSYLPLCLGESEDFTLCARISEFAPAGIHIQPRYLRHYPYQSTLCHTLGYIGKISGEQAENYLQNGYDLSSDLIGKSGIEQMMEPYLRAKKGQKQLSVNSRGLSTSSSALAEAQDGETVVLTIDLALQQAAEAALNETMAKIRSGAMGDAFPNAQISAAVCLDVHSGEVLALASAPGFDPNVFTKALSNTQWQALSPSYLTASGQIDSDPTLPRPLVNNAVCAAFPPGSVFKPITAAAALGAGCVTQQETILDHGLYTAFSQTQAPGCWTWNESHTTHGYVNLHDSLEGSCNYYFYEVGVRTGSEKLEEIAEKFGLGAKTGLGLPGEAAGMVDGQKTAAHLVQKRVAAQLNTLGYTVDQDTLSSALSAVLQAPSLSKTRDSLSPLGIRAEDIPSIYQTINDNRWRESRVLAAAIGQGADSTTPLQMANAIAAITQAGLRYQPTLILSLPDSKGKTEPTVVSRAFMEQTDVHAILQGMQAVTQPGGTAAKYFADCAVSVAGKTGTAQSEGRDAYAWFVAAAPAENPSIAIAVVIGQGGHGGYAAPVAKAIIEAYFQPGAGASLPLDGQQLP